MKKLLQLLIFLSCYALYGQNPPDNYIYLVNGNPIKGMVESADESKIVLFLENGGRYPATRNKFLIFFNKAGNYLTPDMLPPDVVQSAGIIRNFYQETMPTEDAQDILFRINPREVIPCRVKNRLESAVNYTTIDGKSASLNTDNLYALITRDGSHQFFLDPSQATEHLSQMKTDFERARIVKKQIVEIPKPILKPTEPLAEAPATSMTVSQAPPPPVKKKLTEDEQMTYQGKSKEKMYELEKLLDRIVDSKRSREEKDDDIQAAVKMFVPDAKVEVSAVNNPNNKATRSISDYLNRLSRLSYSKVDITYAEINFIDEFSSDGNGNYYGIASYVQTFKTGNFVDVTRKNQKIKLQGYNKRVNGVDEERFDILLGNISISVDQ